MNNAEHIRRAFNLELLDHVIEPGGLGRLCAR